ncbi:MAG: cation:proton antiporter [Nanoarchaeota archaeon]|nr:cation:proton antiporter [Nanoarchaeota archaeon]
MASLFAELAIILIVTFITSLIMNRIKQPLLVGYILTGVVAGPIFFNLLSNPESYEVFSHIGVAFLLFIVGLQLNFKLIKEVGTISLITGIGQIVFTTIFGVLLNLLLGMSWIPALLVAVALTFSSTIIIVKLLSDKKGLEQLYGKISLGFLLVQDVVAVIILMIIGTLSKGSGSWTLIVQTVVLGVICILGIFFGAKPFLSKLLKIITPFKELNFLFILAWCFGISILFEAIGFSLEIGALLAGIVLASTPYQQEISSRIKPLRDFFIILFFVFLGTQLIPAPDTAIVFGSEWSYIVQTLGPIAPQAIILSLFVLIGNPLIVLVLITFFGYSSRTGFLAGLTVSQISEFSIILVLLGQKAGLLSIHELSLVTLIAIITITGSTYLVVYGEKLYSLFGPLFKKLEKKKVKDSLQGIQGQKHDIGIFGYRRIGPHVLREIQHTGLTYLIVDQDPEIIRKLKKEHKEAIFGDVSNIEFLSEFDFKDMNMIISTIPDAIINRTILQNYKHLNPRGIIILTVEERHEAIELYELGADYVIVPHHLGASHLETLFKEFMDDHKRFEYEREKHLGELYEERNYH